MFLNLVASSMKQKSSSTIHPGFVESLRQMSSEDALLFQEIATATDEKQPLQIDFSGTSADGTKYQKSAVAVASVNRVVSPLTVCSLQERAGVIKRDRVTDLRARYLALDCVRSVKKGNKSDGEVMGCWKFSLTEWGVQLALATMPDKWTICQRGWPKSVP